MLCRCCTEAGTPQPMRLLRPLTQLIKNKIVKAGTPQLRLQRRPLMIRMDESRLCCAVQMLHQGQDVNASDYDGRTALMLACMKGHKLLVRVSIDLMDLMRLHT